VPELDDPSTASIAQTVHHPSLFGAPGVHAEQPNPSPDTCEYVGQ
jgi:hypothetical protein